MPQQRGIADGVLGCSWGQTPIMGEGLGGGIPGGPMQGAQDKKVSGARRHGLEEEMSGGTKHTGFV